jgi:serine/threonine-protein kinase
MVALKTLRTGLPSIETADFHRLADRFRREGQALGRLRHEAIVPVFDADVHDGVPFLVMEHEPGGSLADHRERLTAAGPTMVVQLMERVARAVAHAHRQGVLHRDLKPANILLDAEGRPRVSDFGVAKLTGPDDDDLAAVEADDTVESAALATQLTAPGLQPGTWAYMAPEQHDPAAFGNKIGPTADVWALGVILYELLTGRRPFPGPDRAAVREQVCSGRWPPTRELSRPLRRVIGRCLTKEPAGRFQSADELATALKAAAPRRPWRVALVASTVALFLMAAMVAHKLGPEPLPRWPDLPEVRAIEARLARGEAVELIGDGKPRPPFDFALGAASGKVLEIEQRPFTVASSGLETCLVELLPGLPPGHDYQIEAEIRHDRGDGQSSVGIYAAGSRYRVERGRQNLVVSATYADVGVQAAFDAPEELHKRGRDRVACFWLAARYLGESKIRPLDNLPFFAHDMYFDSAEIKRERPGFRSISLKIEAGQFTSMWEGTNAATLSFRQVEEHRDDVCRKRTDLSPDGLPTRPLGSVGVYVCKGLATVRRFVVRPLD